MRRDGVSEIEPRFQFPYPKLCRIANQITQQRLGIDYKYYQRIEYGEKNLSLRMLYKIAKAFDMTISDLLKIE